MYSGVESLSSSGPIISVDGLVFFVEYRLLSKCNPVCTTSSDYDDDDDDAYAPCTS